MRMRSTIWLLAFAVAGCQTLYEELPTRPSSPTNGTPVTVPIVVTPTTLPTPSTPTATPTPTPTANPTPTPSTAPKPTPTPTPTSTAGIHHVRVGFFGFNCPAGITPPNNGAGLLPVGCRGLVTASPKDSRGDDIPASVHGPDISWALEDGASTVRMSNSGVSTFNKNLDGVSPGSFSLCATVKGVKGCLTGSVIR